MSNSNHIKKPLAKADQIFDFISLFIALTKKNSKMQILFQSKKLKEISLKKANLYFNANYLNQIFDIES